jgi:hypothetical protein
VSQPSTPNGTNWSFNNWNQPGNNDPTRPFWIAGGQYRVPASTYGVRNFSAGGEIKVEVQGSSSMSMSISDGITNNGASLTFGDATYRIYGSVSSGSSGITIGNGTFEFGGVVSAGNGATITIGDGDVSFAGTVSIASKIKLGNGTNRFGGANTFSGGGDLEMGDGDVVGDVTLGGSETVVMGTGNRRFGGNVTVGGSAIMTMGAGDPSINGGLDVDGGGTTVTAGDGNVAIGSKTKTVQNCSTNGKNVAIYLGGSSKFLMGDGTFTADGCVATQGGGQIKFGATNNHIIGGDFVMKGGALFRPGRYTTQGNFVNGTGGTGWPSGTTAQGVDCATYDLCGVDVTFILGGTIDLGGGAKVKLLAPTNDTNDELGAFAELLFASKTNASANFGAGSSSIFVGRALPAGREGRAVGWREHHRGRPVLHGRCRPHHLLGRSDGDHRMHQSRRR